MVYGCYSENEDSSLDAQSSPPTLRHSAAVPIPGAKIQRTSLSSSHESCLLDPSTPNNFSPSSNSVESNALYETPSILTNYKSQNCSFKEIDCLDSQTKKSIKM